MNEKREINRAVWSVEMLCCGLSSKLCSFFNNLSASGIIFLRQAV